MRGNPLGHAGAAAVCPALRQHPALQTLRLSKCKLGDRGGRAVLEALTVMSAVAELDLSHNQLGQGPGFGEAVGDFLRTNETVTRLDLGWNTLRLGNAEALCEGLADNGTVEYLTLAWNSFGDRGGCAMGRALRLNRGVLELDLSHNTVGEKGTMVLADALMENKTLEELELDQNPVGPRGGRCAKPRGPGGIPTPARCLIDPHGAPARRAVVRALLKLAEEEHNGQACHYMTQPLVELYAGCMVVLKVS